MIFFYGIDYKFGGSIYVAGGDIFGVEELLEVGRGLDLCVSSVFVAYLVDVYERCWDG
jgi:hypothetical protein